MSGSIPDNIGSNHGQIINLDNGSPSSVHGFDVFVHQSRNSKLALESSPKIRVNTLIGQSWKPSSYYGSMIACSNDYLAYILEGPNGCFVRIIQLKTKDRALLKKFTGKICDLSFAHANSNVLGIVDQASNLHVYDLDSAHGDVGRIASDCLKLKIFSEPQPNNLQHRLVWCPFVHEEDTADSLIVAISNGNRAAVYDVNEIVSEYPVGLVDRTKLTIGRVFVNNSHDGYICDMAISPDGNVLATAGQDGHVKFWQIDIDEPTKEPVRLHDYIPHGGSPVTRLLFCDDHFTKDPKKQFWRFLLTATEYNTVIKVWCTVKWKCLQTISFLPPIEVSSPSSKMIIRLDLSASYLLVADKTSMVLYILPLYQESNIGDASFTSITEYLLTQPILSYVISGHNPVRQVPLDSSEDDDDDGEGEGSKVAVFNPQRSTVMLQLHCIQTKSLQELQVRFEPPGLMGIPPLITAIEQTDSPLDNNLPTDTTPPSKTTTTTNNVQPPLKDSSVYSPSDMPKLEDVYISDDIRHRQYAPGQSSPSVKLLSPETILSHSINSPIGTPSLSLQSSHVLRSPSDFESVPNTVCFEQSDANTDQSESGAKSGSNSQIVTIPLKSYSSTDEETNEELVLGSPSNSLTNDNNNPFPSAHEDTLLDKMAATKMAPLIDEDEDWPVLSTEESEQKPEPQLMEQVDVTIDNNEPLLSMTNDDTPFLSEMNETPVSTDILNNEIKSSNDMFEDEAKKTAVMMVSSVINTAVNIVEGQDIIPIQEEKETGLNEIELEKQSNEETNEEEKEEEVKSKVPTSPPLADDVFTGPPSVTGLPCVTDPPSDADLPSDAAVINEQSYSVVSSHIVTSPTATTSIVDNSTLEALVKTIQHQQLEIHALRNHTQQAINELHLSLQTSMDNFSENQKSFLSQELQDHYQRLEKQVKDKPSLDPKKLTQTLNHTVTSAINSQVEKCVKSEFKRTVPPVIQRQMTSFNDQCVQVMQQRLAMMDGIVREVMERNVNTQGLIDTISNNIASTLHQFVQKNTEALFISSVLPSFQQSLKEIFVQINEAFKAGMTEYLSQLQHHQASLQDNALHSLHSSLVGPTSPLVQMITATLSQELTTLTHQLEQSLSGSVSTVIKAEIEESIAAGNSFGQQQSIKQQKDRIQVLMEEKQYETAFNLALSTSNLELVTQTCQMVGADEVFDGNGESTLTQPVLLSLIQQLAVGLQDEIDLKIKYLEMAILSLDPEDPITSPHLPPVMQLLHEQIRKVEEQLQNSREGTPGLFRAAKRVRMLADHVKKSTK